MKNMLKNGKSGYQKLKEIERRYKSLIQDIQEILIQDWSQDAPKEALAKLYIKYRSMDQ